MRFLNKTSIVLLLSFIAQWSAAQALIDIGIFNNPVNSNVLEVRIRPTMTITNSSYTGVLFTIRWLNSYNVNLGAIQTNPFGLQKSGVEEVSGPYRYQIFSGTNFNAITNWPGGQEIVLMTIAHSSTGSGTGVFSIVNDAWTGQNNGDHYQEIAANDATGIIYNASASSPLPVELLDLRAKPLENAISVDWQSAAEIDFDGYELERSTDGQIFQYLTEKKGTGGAGPFSYNYLDRDVQEGQDYYYRLKMKDLDGKINYSYVVRAKLPLNGVALLQVTPNPALNRAVMQFQMPEAGLVQYTLTDLNGRIIYTQDLETLKGINRQDIDLSGYPSGVYILSLLDGQRKLSVRVVKGGL